MNEPTDQQKQEFKARLKAAQHKRDESSWDGQLGVERSGAAGRAWRLSVEMVAAFVVCGGFGWAIDSWLDTRPVFILVFAVIGMVVGVYNVYKVAKAMNPDDFEQ
ncbi:AtpZ/AtpI family protein [Sneathiella aquimaris]|uniref:AtpZ/AtpI family protein n=1 Tax=Sneathiella aquimaris TaxID=2599305 RepID=UPI00146C2550|nr:AtpZ/AtpI family protein [Sneathiella aquimaris]